MGENSLLPKPLGSVSYETGGFPGLCVTGVTCQAHGGDKQVCSLPLECQSAIQAHFHILYLQLIMMQPDSCFTLFFPLLLAQGEGGITGPGTDSWPLVRLSMRALVKGQACDVVAFPG